MVTTGGTFFLRVATSDPSVAMAYEVGRGEPHRSQAGPAVDMNPHQVQGTSGSVPAAGFTGASPGISSVSSSDSPGASEMKTTGIGDPQVSQNGPRRV
jgi:hypothetical protein